jgi:carbon monoxide dehydrogenase subunit G
MELQGERTIPAPVPVTWAALNDPEVLKRCMAGCESLERGENDTFQVLVSVRVGPVGAKFKGTLRLADVKPPESYTIHFDGQGGAAGFGKGSAEVAVSPQGDATVLRYQARAQVGGKMAQLGSRLIDAAAGKITEDFFQAFDAAVREIAGAVPLAPPVAAPRTRALWWIVAAAAAIALVAYILLR